MLDKLIAEVMQGRSGGTGASAPGASPGASPLMQIILQLLAGGARGGRQASPGGLGGLLSGLQGGAPGAGSLDGLIGMILGGAGPRAGQGGGLGGLLEQLQQSGLGRQADSWVSRGENLPVDREDLTRAFGRERLESLAREHGMDVNDMMSGLSTELPRAVDELTPQGRMPQRDELAGLFEGLGGRGSV